MPAAITALLALLTAAGVQASQAPAGSSPSADYHFTAGTGLLVFHVHRERAGDFEAVARRITDGLQTLAPPVRREQAVGWRFFRARETADAAVYVLLADPVVANADYDPVKLITEVAPADAPELYERLRAAVIRVERLDLERLR